MTTRQRIATTFAAIGNDVRDLVTKTHPNYCPTIQPGTFSEFDRNPALAAEMANFAAQAFDSMTIIYGQSRRAFNHRNNTRAFLGYLRRSGKAGAQ